MKDILLGIVFISIVGIGGFVYRNAVEHPLRPIACPLDALVCPDGTSVARTGSSCTFAACPLPNVSLAEARIEFAIPAGFTVGEAPDETTVAAYEQQTASSTIADTIVIREYAIAASSTALAVIQQTALGGASGLPVPVTSFSSSVLGAYRFSVVSIERFEGVVDTAYYLARGTDVLRFDAIDREVANWTDSGLNVGALPAHAALTKLLATLQVL